MLLAFKLLLAPTLIGLVSLAGRRWGPGVSGWLVSLPLTSAPVILVLAVDQGTTFASSAAQDTLLGVLSMVSFCLVYCWFSLRFFWLASMLAGWAAYFALTAFLERISMPLLWSFVVVIAYIAIVLTIMPESKSKGKGITINPPPWDTPLRMLVATAFVLGLTGAATILGPQLSGLLAPFPMFTTILAVFTHHFQGASAARRVLRGVITGTITFVVFFLVISLLVDRWGIAAAFGLAMLAAVVTHGTTFFVMRKLE
jgi:hypothetical protein